MSLSISTTEAEAALYAVAELVRSRALAGRGCPREVMELYRKLTACGHENYCGVGDSDTVSTTEAAQILGRPERWVRRHHRELGGTKAGDRWRYTRTTINDYAKGPP